MTVEQRQAVCSFEGVADCPLPVAERLVKPIDPSMPEEWRADDLSFARRCRTPRNRRHDEIQDAAAPNSWPGIGAGLSEGLANALAPVNPSAFRGARGLVARNELPSELRHQRKRLRLEFALAASSLCSDAQPPPLMGNAQTGVSARLAGPCRTALNLTRSSRNRTTPRTATLRALTLTMTSQLRNSCAW